MEARYCSKSVLRLGCDDQLGMSLNDTICPVTYTGFRRERVITNAASIVDGGWRNGSRGCGSEYDVIDDRGQDIRMSLSTYDLLNNRVGGGIYALCREQ